MEFLCFLKIGLFLVCFLFFFVRQLYQFYTTGCMVFALVFFVVVVVDDDFIFYLPLHLSVLNAIKRMAQARITVVFLFQLDSNVNIDILGKLNRMLLWCDTMKLVKSR